MRFERTFSTLALGLLAASAARAQGCYEFAGPGATLRITIVSFTAQNGPNFSNGTGYSTNYRFVGTNSLTIGGVTQTSDDTSNGCQNCAIGTVVFSYQPGNGSVTAFSMTVPANDTPLSTDSWFAILGGPGDVIPTGILPGPQAFPPISSWVLPLNEDVIVVNNSSGSTNYPITSVGPCTTSSGGGGGTGGGTPAGPGINAVISASAFGGFSTVAPGTWVEIYGTDLAGGTAEWAGSNFNGNNAPTSLNGVSVSIGGQAAFVEYISAGQVDVELPSNIATSGPLELTLTNGTLASLPVTVNVNPTEAGLLAPASFKIGGNQYVVAQFSDGSYVLPTGAISGVTSRPAQPGDEIVIYGIGFGPVMPAIPAGEIATVSNQLAAQLQITIGNTPAQLKYFGLAPNFVGLYQFNVVVPSVAAGNLVPLTFTLGGTPGAQTLFIAVQ